MSSVPVISVVTVCFNAAETIRNTFESVLSQNVGWMEYIIVDGGSTDGTVEIIESYSDRIHQWTSEPDLGIADAFNKGIARCRGGIIGLLNADDVILPGALQKVVDFFATHPDVGVMHGDVDLYAHGAFVKTVRPAGRMWYPWRLILFNHPATFVKKTVYDQHGLYNVGYRIAMDAEIFLRWQKANVCIEYLPASLVRMNTGGASNRAADLGCVEVRQAFLRYGYFRPLADFQYLCRIILVRVALLLLWIRRVRAGQ